MNEFDETMKDIKENLIARIQRQEKEIERLNNIIGTIKGMFKDNDNHFEDGCDCEKIENFLEILDKENKDIELDMLKALNTNLDDDVEMG